MMTRYSLASLGLAAFLFEMPALAGTCSVHVTGPAGGWKFVQVHDPDKGKVVLGQAIKSGDTVPVTVSGDRVRVDWKLAGHVNYKTGSVTSCKNGNIIRI